MIVVDGVCFKYKEREVLKNINFQIEKGDIVSLLGINGSGKSTLLKTINKILKPYKGTVLIDNDDVQDMSGNQLASLIGYMPQKTNGVFCTVYEAVLLGRKPHIKWNVSKKDEDIVYSILRLMGLEDFAMRNTLELNGGELQKVIIARALAQEPTIFLLDEPINHLDIRNQIEVMNLMRHITKKLNIITIVVMNDLNIYLRFCDKFLMLKNGLVFAFGDREVMNRETLREVYNIDIIIKEVTDGIYTAIAV
jgi:iron complex transport system ATP-binding protein